MSDGERRHVLKLESDPQVVDIWEQYPLWNLEKIMRIAAERGIKYPIDKDGQAYVMSTDVICLRLNSPNAEPEMVAYSCKPTDAICNDNQHPISVKRTLQKISLEEHYWASLNTPCHLITDFHVSRQEAMNLEWARMVAPYSDEFLEFEAPFMEAFISEWTSRPHEQTRAHFTRAAERLRISTSQGFALFRWGIWTHQIPADLDLPIHPLRPLKLGEIEQC